MSKRWRGIILMLGIVTIAGALAPAASEPPAPQKDAQEPLAVNKALAEEQLKLIDEGLADLDRLYKGGNISINDPGFNRWARRRVDAIRESGAEKAKIVAALEKYVKRTKDVEGLTKTLHQK